MTSGEEWDYFSRVTGSWRPTIGSQQPWLALRGIARIIWHTGYEGRYGWAACHLFIEEEYLIGHDQDNFGLSTYSCTRDTQRIESGNNISRTRVWVHRRMTWLQDKYKNNIWRVRSAHGY